MVFPLFICFIATLTQGGCSLPTSLKIVFIVIKVHVAILALWFAHLLIRKPRGFFGISVLRGKDLWRAVYFYILPFITLLIACKYFQLLALLILALGNSSSYIS